jgi:hypothetical protein
MNPLLIQLAIATASKYIPKIIESKIESPKAKAIANTIFEAAKEFTGESDPQEALNKVQDSPEFFKLHEQSILKELEFRLEDIQHAREHNNDEVTRNLSYVVMYLNPLLIGVGVYAFIYVMQLDLSKDVSMALSALIGGIVNQLMQERQQVMNYRFGSTIGSKLKDWIKKETR